MEMVKYLQSSFANIEMTNYAGITAIMTAQARGYSDIASMLLRGLDTKSYMEHKEKEKVLIPKEKKMPLPRIPSKSHLIVPENGTPATKVQRSDYYPESSTSHQVSMVTEDDAEAHSSVEPESSEVKDISERSNIPSFHGVKLKLHPIADKLSIVYYTNQAGQNVIVGKMCGTQFIGIPTLNSTAKANAQRESFINSQPSIVDVNIEREEEVTALTSDGEGEGHTGREVVEEEENEVMDLTMSRSAGSDQKSNYKTNSQLCHSVDSYVRDMGQQSSTGEVTSNNSRHYMDDVNHMKHNAEPGAGTNSVSSVVNDHKISDVQHNPVTNNASPSTGPKQNTAVSETAYFPANNISADGENISILQQRAAIISSILRNTALLTNHQVYPLPVIPKAPEKASNSNGPRVKVEREPQVSPLYNRGSHVVVDKEVDNNGKTADIHERVGHEDSVQNEITESPRKTKSGKERKSIKKEKSIGGAKNRPKETKKEDKTAVRSKSPTLRTDNNGKTKEGIVAPKPANQSFGNITNITASVASSLQAKLLGMMGNKPLNLTTTDRNVSEESKTKEVPVTSS
ncbi:hypothetical protein FSP39_005892 [Pinctada imbricata]|uniref:Uncharacterized protein n=1 Tax=Pinctada imbricata TaxID=66713 RepID=A0AA88YVK5_PINIB|nr:hypothetical protein FSP39_005892 [Pinctada imbricata]